MLSEAKAEAAFKHLWPVSSGARFEIDQRFFASLRMTLQDGFVEFLMTAGLWNRETFVEKLRAIGVRGYHDKHPFHVAMNEGRLSPEALRGWVANRFYYQRNIPIKDAAILANCPVREVRRAWIHRILDHDGVFPQPWRAAAPARRRDDGHDARRQRPYTRRRYRSMAATW